ncbi:hypothetical protein [Thalassospira lucentensis]|uniref:hypothetical protein n=1 Tax=Thalassospira lucentensis TaxID=168935 RepID=UPI00399D6691
MIITPDCEITTLDKVIPKQIVRDTHYDLSGRLSLVSSILDDDTTRALIHFDEDGPKYDIIKNPKSFTVLKYNQEPTLEIDQSEKFGINYNNIHEKNGLIIRNADTWIMTVALSQSHFSFRDKGYYDLNKGSLVNSIDLLSEVAIFGKWELYIQDTNLPHTEKVKIASFQQE